MPRPHAVIIPSAPFAGLLMHSFADRGILTHDRDGLGLATILAKKNQTHALVQRMRECFNIDLPLAPRRTSAENLALMGTGPAAWLAAYEHGGNLFAATLREKIGDLASISDQSDGYAVLRLSGPKVRDTLSKLMPIDLHPRAFKIGDVAATVAAHIGVTAWRLDDNVDGSPRFEIALFRSLVASFWRALTESAGESSS